MTGNPATHTRTPNHIPHVIERIASTPPIASAHCWRARTKAKSAIAPPAARSAPKALWGISYRVGGSREAASSDGLEERANTEGDDANLAGAGACRWKSDFPAA